MLQSGGCGAWERVRVMVQPECTEGQHHLQPAQVLLAAKQPGVCTIAFVGRNRR